MFSGKYLFQKGRYVLILVCRKQDQVLARQFGYSFRVVSEVLLGQLEGILLRLSQQLFKHLIQYLNIIAQPLMPNKSRTIGSQYSKTPKSASKVGIFRWTPSEAERKAPNRFTISLLAMGIHVGRRGCFGVGFQGSSAKTLVVTISSTVSCKTSIVQNTYYRRIFFYQYPLFYTYYSYSMSLNRQNTLQELQSQALGSRLFLKQSIIQKLRAEVTELTKTRLDCQHSEEGVERLKKKYADAEKEKDKSDWIATESSRVTEETLKSVKSEFEDLTLTLQSKSCLLGDLLAEKNCLEQNIAQKNVEIEKLKERAEIEHEERKLAVEHQSLAHQEQMVKGQVKNLRQEVETTQKTNRDVSRTLSNKQGAVLSLKLQKQNKDRKLDHYERENNAINAQVQKAAQKQAKLLNEVCENESSEKQLELEGVALKAKSKKLQNELDELNKLVKVYEKQKNKEARQAIKSKQNLLKRLSDAQETEHHQNNLLTKKNAQIAEINNKLKEDSRFCDQHLTNLKRCNELMAEFLEKCKAEDLGLIQMLQKRLTCASSVVQKSTVEPSSDKMGNSRSTQNSGWLGF